MTLMSIMEQRHSRRMYTGEPIPEEKLNTIIRAGLLAPSGRNKKPVDLIVVTDRECIEKLSMFRSPKPTPAAEAGAMIVVIGDTSLSDTWIEDCSIVMEHMHLMASSLGIASCWNQGRLRGRSEDLSADTYVREVLGYPEHYQLEAILALGIPAAENEPTRHAPNDRARVHYGRYSDQPSKI